MICFHGYGELGDHFRLLDRNEASDFSFYCIDLPHHGRTIWKEENAFLIEDLLEIRQAVVEKHLLEFAHLGLSGKYSLIGYSLGGRVALRLFQADPKKVERLILLAPDGLNFSFWYWFATSTKLGNRIFHYTMHHSLWFLKFLRQVKKLKLVNKSRVKFITDYVEHPNSRRLIYHRWRTLRRLHPSGAAIRRKIRENQTATRLLHGRFDRIIKPATGRSFIRSISPHGTFTELPCGHQVLLAKNAESILKALVD
ncbi:MAG: alpha/beta hydrolase [Chitinophagaceae bacterium]